MKKTTVAMLFAMMFVGLMLTATVGAIQTYQIHQLNERIDSLETKMSLTIDAQDNVVEFQDQQVRFNTSVLTMLTEGTWESR